MTEFHRHPEDEVFYCKDTVLGNDNMAVAMKAVARSISLEAQKRLAAHGITDPQCSPLYHLAMRGRATVTELSRLCQIDSGAMGRLLDRLENKAMLGRTRSTEDRRIVDLALTPQGEAVALIVSRLLREVIEEHLHDFTEAEKRTLTGLLMRMRSSGKRH